MGCKLVNASGINYIPLNDIEFDTIQISNLQNVYVNLYVNNIISVMRHYSNDVTFLNGFYSNSIKSNINSFVLLNASGINIAYM